jgi:mannosyltransferase OCH1-like enzyme
MEKLSIFLKDHMHNESFKLKCFDNKEQLYFYQNIRNIPNSTLQYRLSAGLDSLLGQLNIDEENCINHVSESQLKNTLRQRSLIPQICHYIWMTEDSAPLNTSFVKVAKQNQEILDCQTIFWTTNQFLLPEILDTIKNIGGEIKSLHEMQYSEPNAYFWFKTLYGLSQIYSHEVSRNMLAMTSSIARYYVLKEYGGTYIDNNYLLESRIKPIIDCCDFLTGGSFSESGEFLLDNRSVSSKKNHTLLSETLEDILENISLFIPHYTKIIASESKDIFLENKTFESGLLQNSKYHHILLNCNIESALDATSGLHAFTSSFLQYEKTESEINIILPPTQLSIERFNTVDKNFLNIDINLLQKSNDCIGPVGSDIYITKDHLQQGNPFDYYIKGTFSAGVLSNLNPYYLSGNKDLVNNHCGYEVFNGYEAVQCILKYKYNFDYYQFFWENLGMDKRTITTNGNNNVRIPKILHHIWLSDSSLKSPSSSDFNAIIESIITTGWKGMLWQNSGVIYANQTFCSLYRELGGEIHHINELIQNKEYSFFYKQLRLDNPTNHANKEIPKQLTVEVFRAILLNEIGGVVLNIGYKIINTPDNIHSALDFYAVGLHYETIGGGYLASVKGHPIIAKTLEIMSENFIHNTYNTDNYLRFLPNYDQVSCQGYVEYILQGSIMLAYVLESSKDTIYKNNAIFSAHLLNHNADEHTSIQEYILVDDELIFIDRIGHQAYTGYWRDNCASNTNMIAEDYSSQLIAEDFFDQLVDKDFYEQLLGDDGYGESHNYVENII